MSIFPTPLGRRDWWWFGFGLIAALGVLGVYYVSGWRQGADTSLLIMYRPEGDGDALPVTRQFGEGQFGEAYTPGRTGEGWVGFPCASMLPHGLALRVLGPTGFALADIVTPCLYFILLARVLMCAGAAPRVSLLLASFTTLQGFTALAGWLTTLFGYSLHGIPFYLDFLQSWHVRFPRTLVSDIYVLGAVASWIELARHGLARRISWWVGTAVWLAAVMQCDIYSFIALGFAFGGFGIAALIRQAADWRWIAQRSVLFAVVFFVLVLPFLLQRWHVSADIVKRFGVFSLPRDSALMLARRAWHFFPSSFVVGTFLLPWFVHGALRWLGQAAFFPARWAAALTVLQAAGYVALPSFVALTGQAVQLYHFRDAAHGLVALVALVSLALVATVLAGQPIMRRFGEIRSLRVGTSVASVVLIAALFFPLLSHANTWYVENPNLPQWTDASVPAWSRQFRDDWIKLAHELERADYARDHVLATANRQVFSWWTGLRGGQSFLAQSLASTLPDRDLLRQLVWFARFNQVAAKDFGPWLTEGSYAAHVNWLSNNLYGANALHTMAPLDDYTPAQRAEISAVIDPLDCWRVVAVPQSELRRFTQAYAETLTVPLASIARPDLLLLTEEWPELKPDPAIFALVYQNPTFRLYRPLSAGR